MFDSAQNIAKYFADTVSFGSYASTASYTE